jgi:hypothetical protein
VPLLLRPAPEKIPEPAPHLPSAAIPPSATAPPSAVAPSSATAPPSVAEKEKAPLSVKQALQEAEKIRNDKPLTWPKLQQAHNYYQLALKIAPGRPDLIGRDNSLFPLLMAIEAKINGYLDSAAAAVKDGRLTEPEKNNAADYYRQVLELYPGHPDALQGLDKIAGVYADRAEAHLNLSETAAAERDIRLGLSAKADHPKLLALAAKIKAAGENRADPGFLEHLKSPFL